VGRRLVESLWDLKQEATELVILWREVIVDELGLLIVPAIFVVNDSTEDTFDRRCTDLYGRT